MTITRSRVRGQTRGRETVLCKHSTSPYCSGEIGFLTRARRALDLRSQEHRSVQPRTPEQASVDGAEPTERTA